MPNIENTDMALLSFLTVFIVIGMTCLVASTFAEKSKALMLRKTSPYSRVKEQLYELPESNWAQKTVC